MIMSFLQTMQTLFKYVRLFLWRHIFLVVTPQKKQMSWFRAVFLQQIFNVAGSKNLFTTKWHYLYLFLTIATQHIVLQIPGKLCKCPLMMLRSCRNNNQDMLWKIPVAAIFIALQTFCLNMSRTHEKQFFLTSQIIWIKMTTFFKRRVSIILWSFSS